MRILHIIPSISPIRGGPSTAIVEMVKALRQNGVEASILTTNDHGTQLYHKLPVGHWIEHRGVPVLAFARWNPPLAFIQEYNISTGLTCWLLNNIHDYDLLHIHALFSYPSTISMIIARQKRVPYILRTIGQLESWSLAQKPWRKRIMLSLIEKRNIESAITLHFTSSMEAKDIDAICKPKQKLVIPLGVSNPSKQVELSRKKDSSKTTFLFLSRIHPKKNLMNLIEALAIMNKRKPGARWELLIAGTGDSEYTKELHDKIGSLSIAKYCSWLGFIEGDYKWNILKMADWLVLPSASENFGIVVVEALATGTPVIISPEVAISDIIVKQKAGLVSSSMSAKLANTLEKALDGPSLEMKKAALLVAQEYFSWKIVANELKQYYSSALRGTGKK